MTINRQWLLAEGPSGMVGPHKFKYAETPIPEPKNERFWSIGKTNAVYT